MSTYYELFCEAKIDGVWTDIDFHLNLFGHDRIVPVIEGCSPVGLALGLKCPGDILQREDLSDALRPLIINPKQFMYMDEIGNKNLELPEICGFFPKQSVYDFEAGDLEDLDDSSWEVLSEEEYSKLDDEQKKAYVYYEYTEPWGTRDVLRRIKRAVEARIEACNNTLWLLPGNRKADVKPSDVRIIIKVS